MKLKNGTVISLDEFSQFTRRDFCRVAGAALVALGLPACDAGPVIVPTSDDAATTMTPQPDLKVSGPACPGGVTDTAMTPSQFAVNTATYFDSDTAFVCRDAGGIFALTAVCTHEGTTIDWKGTGFVCPNHNAHYNIVGKVTLAAARGQANLNHYPVCVTDNGTVAFDPNNIAMTTDRLVV